MYIQQVDDCNCFGEINSKTLKEVTIATATWKNKHPK